MNENVHVNTNPKFTKLVDVIVDYLKYDLYRKAVERELILVDDNENSNIPDVVKMAGRTFDEYLKFVEEGKRKVLKLPVVCEFRITDNDNPCKDWIASDCTYKFEIRRGIGVSGGSVLDSAFVTTHGENHTVHNIEFLFSGTLNTINELKSVIRHELKHAYCEFMYHCGLEKKLNAEIEKELGENTMFGEYKDKDESRKQRYYNYFIDIIKNVKPEPEKSFEENSYFASMHIIAKALYLLSDKEISANYSQYYQECLNNPNNMWFDGTYSVYENLGKQIDEGVMTMCTEGNHQTTKRIFPFDNHQAFETIKKYAKFVIGHVPDTKEEFKEHVLQRIRLVLKRMENIYKFVHNRNNESAYDMFNKAVDKHYEMLREECISLYGEEKGMVRFVCERNLNRPAYEEVIDEINKEIF